MTSHGSHKLTPEQAAEMEARFGVRYSHVETAPYGLGMNRAQRRRLNKNRSTRP